ncbi:MAG: hypothetical protein M3O46_20370, partial [Myxococcota bacterium]|nr:hypothetical protein [Myxococcota bacterium]
MTAHKKDGKSERVAVAPLTVKTVFGVPQLPAEPPLDLDMEELSGSLLLEEASFRGAQMEIGADGPPAPMSPFLPTASSRPAHPAVPMPPLPKP